uniref:Uncharacterized protein n=1 Tax=viral metagenome TaxID=1070528 RepID=A0A6C0I1R0_9ZZZZ
MDNNQATIFIVFLILILILSVVLIIMSSLSLQGITLAQGGNKRAIGGNRLEELKSMLEDLYGELKSKQENLESFEAQLNKLLKTYSETNKGLKQLRKDIERINTEIKEVESHIAETRLQYTIELLTTSYPEELQKLQDFSEIDELYKFQLSINKYYPDLLKELQKFSLDDLMRIESKQYLEDKLNSIINAIREYIDKYNKNIFLNNPNQYEVAVTRGVEIKKSIRQIKDKLLKKYDELTSLIEDAQEANSLNLAQRLQKEETEAAAELEERKQQDEFKSANFFADEGRKKEAETSAPPSNGEIMMNLGINDSNIRKKLIGEFMHKNNSKIMPLTFPDFMTAKHQLYENSGYYPLSFENYCRDN